jgi:AraC-like DNA-binding protein
VETLGFFDLLVPVVKDGRECGVLLSGPFAGREPDAAFLRTNWERLSGRDPSTEDPEFMEYVRVALGTPILDGPLLPAYEEALGLFSRILTREAAGIDPYRRLRRLMVEVFARRMPHGFFLGWALGLPTLQSTPPWGREVPRWDWVREEIGLTRIPTTVLAVAPAPSPARRLDPVEDRVRIRRLQRESFQFARTLPQTVGGALEDYGAAFITSPDPSKGRLQRGRQVAETAERIRRFAAKAWGGEVQVGVGGSVLPGEGLAPSLREAVLALHLGKQTGRPVVHFRPERSQGGEGGAELGALLSGLETQVGNASREGAGEAADAFLKQALTLSFQNPGEIRWHLHYGLLRILAAVGSRSDLGEKGMEHLHREMLSFLERAATTPEMVEAFKAALGKLLGMVQGRERPEGIFTMERIQAHLERHFREPVRASILAKMAGLSPSTLSRRFKKATGLKLETRLQELRLQEARRLLRSGNLPVVRVAKACGFKSVAHFIRLFHKKTGVPPQKYRAGISGNMGKRPSEGALRERN